MHSFKGDKVTFNCNSDLSGDVQIKYLLLNGEEDGDPPYIMHVPGKDLLDFIANYVRGCYISRLEGMGTEEILGTATKETQE